MKIGEEIINEIKRHYYNEETVGNISMYTGVSETAIMTIIRNKVNTHEWEKHSHRKKAEIKCNPDGTVVCNRHTCLHCVYGISSGEMMCHYYLTYGVGNRRNCPADHCDKFEYGTPRDKLKRGQSQFNDEIFGGKYERASDNWKRHYKADNETY